VTSLKQDFVRLALGMFAASFASYPVTFSLGGVAEAPQGSADIVDVKGQGTFALRLFVDRQTHLPIMVSWTQPATSPAKPVESRVYYADYREVGSGIRFPFRIRRAVAGDTVEETNFDAFKVNARIDPRRFEALK
jgi:hypothetical protein